MLHIVLKTWHWLTNCWFHNFKFRTRSNMDSVTVLHFRKYLFFVIQSPFPTRFATFWLRAKQREAMEKFLPFQTNQNTTENVVERIAEREMEKCSPLLIFIFVRNSRFCAGYKWDQEHWIYFYRLNNVHLYGRLGFILQQRSHIFPI